MDEYKPINVHGILLTAVHHGRTDCKDSAIWTQKCNS